MPGLWLGLGLEVGLSNFRTIKPSDCRHIILLWGTTVGYPSDSMASSCYTFWSRLLDLADHSQRFTRATLC